MAHDKGNASATWIAIQQWFFGWIVVPTTLVLIAYGIFFMFFYPEGFSAMIEILEGNDEVFFAENMTSMFILDSILRFIGASASAIFLKKSYEIDSANYIANVSAFIAGGLMTWAIIADDTFFTLDTFMSYVALVIFYVATRIFLRNDRE